MPHLVNLNEDPLMSECLIYQIKPGKTVVGCFSGQQHADIRLSGEGIEPAHCYFDYNVDGSVFLHALEGGNTLVNGQCIMPMEPRKLKSGYIIQFQRQTHSYLFLRYRVIMGDFHVFRFKYSCFIFPFTTSFFGQSSDGSTEGQRPHQI